MKRTTILGAVLAPLAAVALAVMSTPALAAAQEDFHWAGRVAPGAAVEIKGVNGGVVATGAPGGDVEVTAVKKGRKSDPKELELLARAKEALSAGKALRGHFSSEEREALKGYALLTAKPMLVVVNVSESEAAEPGLADKLGLGAWESAPGIRLAFVSARIESEIAELSPEDAKAFRDELGLSEGMVERVVRAAFELMDVITFYTAGDTESRAWIVPRNTRAVKAAGTIHSDMERGFIRAEVVHYDVLVAQGSWNACKDKGLLRLEGKDYPLVEADVVFFRFNV